MKPEIQQVKAAESQWLELVRRQVESLRFGVVHIVVHDGRVTQIEKTEKLRLESGKQPVPSLTGSPEAPTTIEKKEG